MTGWWGGRGARVLYTVGGGWVNFFEIISYWCLINKKAINMNNSNRINIILLLYPYSSMKVSFRLQYLHLLYDFTREKLNVWICFSPNYKQRLILLHQSKLCSLTKLFIFKCFICYSSQITIPEHPPVSTENNNRGRTYALPHFINVVCLSAQIILINANFSQRSDSCNYVVKGRCCLHSFRLCKILLLVSSSEKMHGSSG